MFHFLLDIDALIPRRTTDLISITILTLSELRLWKEDIKASYQGLGYPNSLWKLTTKVRLFIVSNKFLEKNIATFSIFLKIIPFSTIFQHISPTIFNHSSFGRNHNRKGRRGRGVFFYFFSVVSVRSVCSAVEINHEERGERGVFFIFLRGPCALCGENKPRRTRRARSSLFFLRGPCVLCGGNKPRRTRRARRFFIFSPWSLWWK